MICDFDPYHEDETILKIQAQINQFIYMVKGQIISEAIFLVLNSSKKQMKCLQNFAPATRAEIFRSFFGRIEKN